MAKIFSYIPSSYKSGTAYTAIPNDANADFDVTRASVANRINQSGLIEEMSAGVPRVDYYLGGCPTLLKEPAATNYINWSSNFNQWEKYSTGTGIAPVVTSDYGIAPNGQQEADRVQFNTNSGGGDSLLRRSHDTGIDTRTGSLWVKSLSGNANVILDISNSSTTVHAVTTEWTRIDVQRTTASAGNLRANIGTRASQASSDILDLLIWECQVEIGSIPTSNIYTNGSVETREADIITGAEATFDSRQGVMNLRASFTRESNDTQSRMLNLSNGLITDRIEIFANVGSDSTINIYLQNDAEIVSKVFNIDNTQENEYALKWGQDIVSFKINGIEVLTNESFNTYTLNKLTEVNLADVSGAVNHLYGRVRHINIFDTIDSYDSDFDTYNAMATFAKYTIA